MNPDSIIATLSNAFGWVWATSLYASVLITLVFAIQLAFGKRLPARSSYVLGLLVLLRLILPVVPTSSFSVFNLSRGIAAQPIRREVPLTITSKQSFLAQPSTPSAELSALAEPTKAAAVIGLPVVAGAVWLAGLALSLLLVGRQHWKFFHRITRDPAIEEERVRALMDKCRATMGVKRELRVVVTPHLTTPALFGWFRPRLLLPEGTLQRLDEHELRMVFLHELAHVKRGDIMLNWIMIVVRSIHWFNPLVWLAMRRLRADRELVCDAMVLARLGTEERQSYGNTLIKLLDEFSDAGFCPSLAPVINHKHEIKRRVTMIVEFKPISRIVLLLSAATIVALCCFTFTRAAEKDKPAEARLSPPREGDAGELLGKAPTEDFPQARTSGAMKRKLVELSERIRQKESVVDDLRQKLGISALTASGKVEGSMDPETVRRTEAMRLEVESNYNGQAVLLASLKELRVKGGDALRKAILTANPDPQLGKLLEDLWATEATLAKLKETQGPDHPEFKSVAAMQTNLTKLVNDRVEGILSGLEARVAATKAQLDALTRRVEDAKKEHAAATAFYRPYFQAKRDLDALQKVRDALYLKILEQEYGVEVPKSTNTNE